MVLGSFVESKFPCGLKLLGFEPEETTPKACLLEENKAANGQPYVLMKPSATHI